MMDGSDFVWMLVGGIVGGIVGLFYGALMAVAAHADARKATMSREGFDRLDRDVSSVVGPLSRN